MDYLLIALCGVLIGFLGGMYFAWRRYFNYGTMGIPQPDAVNCETGEVWGTLSPTNADEPDDYRAHIYDSCPSPTPDPSTMSPLMSLEPAPNFHLQGVGVDASHTDPVCVLVWARYGDNYYLLGRNSDLNCGSGSGNAALLARRSGEAQSQQVADTAPLQCTLDVTGFGPSLLTSFNQVWNLVHRGSGLLWDNGGDGSREPRVELATERPFGTPWKLTFRLGEIVISYTVSAEDWRALAANTFRSVSATGITDDATLPASITVVPA